MDNLTDDEHIRMCKMCEVNILKCNSSSITFLCEGSMCDEAYDMFSIDDVVYSRKIKLEKLNGIKKNK